MKTNTLTSLVIGLGLLSTASFVEACQGEAPKYIADPEARLQWIRDAQAAEEKRALAARPAQGRGASALRPSPRECFVYPNLRSEEEIPCLAPLIRAYRALPKQIRLVDTVRDGKALRIAVHQVGTGTHHRVLICLPGVMTDHESWRFVAGALAGDYDFWLIDPPGCGGSDAPDPKVLGPGGYSPSAMADRELQAIRKCLSECPRPVRPVLVGHSLGGAVALRSVADPDLHARYHDVLQRLEGLVVIAPADVVINRADPHFIQMSELKGLVVNLGDGLGVVRDMIAKYLLTSSSNARCVCREEVDRALHVVTDPGHRHAFQEMLREALPFHEKSHEPNWPEMIRLEGWYKNVDLPVRIIWGACDQTMPVAMGYKEAAQLPRAKLTIMPDCMHSPIIECPAVCAQFMKQAELSLRTEPPAVFGQEDSQIPNRSFRAAQVTAK